MEEIKLTPEIKQAVWTKSPYYWIIDNKIKNEKGIELEFTNHSFLKDIYDDWAQIQVVRKAAQVGFTTMKMLKALCAAKYKKYNIIYTLPTFQMVQDIVPGKLNALISQNPLLASWIKDKDSVFQKQVGNSFIYFRGTASGKTEQEKMETGVGISLTSSLNIHDECDRSDQGVLEQYESRLGASDYQGKWYFSNPTTPNTLSQKLYEQSDQKHWFIKCSHCNHWQYLDYWKNVKAGQFVCEKCGGIITDEDRRNGQWVKKYQNRTISGYWISHLTTPWHSAQEIEDAYLNRSKQYFYNFVLGLPYIGSDIVVNRDIILRNIDLAEPNFQEHNVLGVDQGLQKHWVLGNKQGIFAVGQTDSWDDIDELIRVYDVETAVFDALPDLTEPRRLRDRYPGKVWLHYYKKEVKKADYVFWDHLTHTVYSDRSKIIQQVIDDMVHREIKFQMKQDELGDYSRHWTSLYKTVEQDSLGLERDVWSSNGEDHFVHATVYWALAKGQTGDAEVKEWGKQEKIYDGLAPDISQIIKEQEQFE